MKDLAGSESGTVVLPLHLYWSDGQNRFDLGDNAEVRLLYQTLLR